MRDAKVRPVLAALCELVVERGAASIDELCARLGREPGDLETLRALGALHSAREITGITWDSGPELREITVTVKGLRRLADDSGG